MRSLRRGRWMTASSSVRISVRSFGPGRSTKMQPRLPCAAALRLERRRDGRPLGGRLVGAVDAQHVGPRADHLGRPLRGHLRGIGRGHHDEHMTVGRAGSEQRVGVLVQQGFCVRAIERVRRGAPLAGEPGAQTQHGVAHMPFRAAERGQAGRREPELQSADVPAAQAEVVREVSGAELMLRQRGLHPCAVSAPPPRRSDPLPPAPARAALSPRVLP